MGCSDGVLSCHFAERWDHDCLLPPGYHLPACHHDGNHTPVEYALHPWFIPRDVATHEATQTGVGGIAKVNVAACFWVLCMGGMPWAVQVQPKRRHGDAICSSGDETFVLASFLKIMV